jgi:two-component system, cell cycle response regulator
MVRRLTAQGYSVEAAGDPLLGADLALSAPPSAVVADFWMPGISGIQLCRLLRTEPATADVPVLLRGDDDDPRHRFWAERAGAFGYVRKGRIGELVRMLTRAMAKSDGCEDGFFQVSNGAIDIRERIARYLDQALFESVIAAEVRSLTASGSFDRLFDLFSQFLAQVITYRWVALTTHAPQKFALHHHPSVAKDAEREARAALELDLTVPMLSVIDEDAEAGQAGMPAVVCAVPFGGTELGRLALAPSGSAEQETRALMALIARELGGPVRIAGLMDEQERLATLDPLTTLRNRRAFSELVRVELQRCQRYELPLSLILLDLDHFKAINDGHGHAAGDRVLSSVGGLLGTLLRNPDVAGRWGGEEFVIALTNTATQAACVVAERVRAAVQELQIEYSNVALRASASLGVAEYRAGESLEALIDRADRAMYQAKVGGRNRVEAAGMCDTTEARDGRNELVWKQPKTSISEPPFPERSPGEAHPG